MHKGYNAGYAEDRIRKRHDIMLTYILKRIRKLKLRRDREVVYTSSKIAMERVNHASLKKMVKDDKTFPNPENADADHIVR